MDAFDITTKDNPGSSLPMSSNAGLKEEFEFLPQIGNQTSLKVLKRLSYVSTFITAFGLTYNGTSLAYFPSSYNIICTLTSLISLALSAALIFWSTKTLKKQQDNTILSNDDNSAELLNHGLYTAAMFRAVVSIPILANMFFQGDNTLHHLRAFGATYEDASYQDTEATLRSIGSVQPFLEVLLSLFFIQATRTIFPHIREPVNAVTRMIFIGSAVLMASSFALIYSARYASDYQTLHNLKFPSLDLDGFMLLGVASVIIAGLVWFMNHIKSENNFSRTATVLGSLTLGLAILSGFGYSNTQEIARQFGSFENLNTEWAEQMAGTSIQDIENYGCPSKYLPRHIASDPSFERLWGPGATTRDGLESRFLNIACTELFGNQQASSFAEATSFGLLNIASSLIIILGFLYFKHIQWRNVEAGSKKDFRWLGLFGFMFLVFAGTMIFYTPPTPSQNGFAFGTRAHAFDIIHDSENMLLAGLDTNPYGGIYKDIIARKYRFVVLKDHPTIPATTIAQAGPWAWKFNDFVNAIVSDEEQVGIVQLGEPGFETPYVVVYAPRVARIQDVLSGFNVAGDTQTLQQNGLPGAHYYIARNKDDLDLQKILFESRVGTIALLNEVETNNGMVMEDYGLVLAAAADNTYSGVFRLLTSKQRRFLVLKHDPVNPMNIRVETGPWAWLFSDFANAFISTQEQVGFIMLGQEGKEQPYMVVYGPQNTKAEQVLNGFGLPLNTQDLQQQGLAGVNSYVAHIKDEINLNNVVMNSRSGRILVLAGEEEDPSGLILAGAGPYDVPFQHLKDRKARFVVLSHDTRSYQKINIAEGNSQSLFNDFADQFEDGKELVGLMLLGETNKEKPYLVILAPGNKNAAQVLSGFQLPTNTNQFEKLGFKGINYYVAKKKKDIDLTKVVMQSKLTGDINMYQDAALMLATDDTNPYGNIFEALSDKKYRYVVLKRDPQNPLNINVEAAPWNWLFQDFVNAIDPTQEQVGIIYLGQADSEKPYVIVFTPRNGGSSVSTVLNEFALPGSTAELEKAGLPGVSYYVAREMRDLDLATVVMQSKVGSISMLNDLDDPNYAEFSMFASANSLYGSLIKQISDKTVRYAVLSRDPKDSSKTKVETGPWKTTFNEFAGKMDASKEQVGIIVLGQGNQEKPFVVITAPKNANVGAILNSYGLPGTVEELEKLGLKNVNAYVVRDKSDLNMARVVMWAKSKGQISFIDEDGQEIFVDVASSPYNNLFDLLSKKKHRFAVLRHDPQNPMNIKVVVAPWDLEFKDFVQTINPTQEQVGIVYLGQTGAEVPYLVVFSPPGTTTSGVLDGFGLPYNTAELAKAGLPGVQYYVADEIRDLDLNNIVMRAQQGTITVLSEQADQEGMFMNAAELEAGQDYSVLQATASSPYAPLLKALAERRYRFIKLKTNPENNLGVKVTGGPWAATFDQFLGVMEANTEQVAFVYVGPQNQEKLYRVVVAPNGNAGKILDNLQLPRTASDLEKIGLRGVPTYVASSGSDLTAQKIITGSKADVA